MRHGAGPKFGSIMFEALLAGLIAVFQWPAIGFLFLGVLFSSIGIKPIEIIKFAQVANGMLLPIIAGILLWIMNKKNVLGNFVNTKTQNILGFVILAIAVFLGAKGILKVFNFI